MSDTELQKITASGSGKSEAEVAFDLLNKLKGQGVWGEKNLSAILDIYAECLDAAKGLRAYEGQKRVEVPIRKAAEPSLKAAATQPPVKMQTQAAPRQAPPAQAQAQAQTQAPQAAQIVTQQPVHAQQQAVAQAYKPA